MVAYGDRVTLKRLPNLSDDTWTGLAAHAARLAATPVRELFVSDPNRYQTLTLEAEGLLVDCSRQGLEGAVDVSTSIGFVGVGAIVFAYFANQQGWLNSDDWRSPAANLVGALLILSSLWSAWNFPSFVIEVIWTVISLYGLARCWRGR